MNGTETVIEVIGQQIQGLTIRLQDAEGKIAEQDAELKNLRKRNEVLEAREADKNGKSEEKAKVS